MVFHGKETKLGGLTLRAKGKEVKLYNVLRREEIQKTGEGSEPVLDQNEEV